MCQIPAPARSCYSDRWIIKTGNDTTAATVSSTEFATTISFLQLQTLGKIVLDDGNRIAPIEQTRYLVDGILVSYKTTTDSEYQLVLKSTSGVTMNAAIPHPDCAGQNSPFFSEIKAARATFDKTFVAQALSQVTQTPVRIGGIGFWQGTSDPSGTPINHIELHPVTSIQFYPTDDLTTFNGSVKNYLIAPTKIGYTVSTLDGVALLATNIQRLKFGDVSVALDLDGAAGKAYRLYQAAFNRTPDLSGLGYWIQAMDKGMTLQDVAESFMASPEFKLMYGTNPAKTALISRFYANVLHRAPDQAGYDYWVNQLDKQVSTPAAALASFSESDENKTQTASAIKGGIQYVPYK